MGTVFPGSTVVGIWGISEPGKMVLQAETSNGARFTSSTPGALGMQGVVYPRLVDDGAFTVATLLEPQ